LRRTDPRVSEGLEEGHHQAERVLEVFGLTGSEVREDRQQVTFLGKDLARISRLELPVRLSLVGELRVPVAHQAWELIQVFQGCLVVAEQWVERLVVAQEVLLERWATWLEGLLSFRSMMVDLEVV
jgi:hypothetical protein